MGIVFQQFGNEKRLQKPEMKMGESGFQETLYLNQAFSDLLGWRKLCCKSGLAGLLLNPDFKSPNGATQYFLSD